MIGLTPSKMGTRPIPLAFPDPRLPVASTTLLVLLVLLPAGASATASDC